MKKPVMKQFQLLNNMKYFCGEIKIISGLWIYALNLKIILKRYDLYKIKKS